MGLVLNPTGYRIGYTKYWFDSWYLHRINYPVFVHKSLEMKLLLEYALRRRKFLRAFWIYSHITYHYFNNKFHVNVFVYDGNNPMNYYNLSKKLRWRWFIKSKFYNRFTKKELLDEMYYYQRWWLLCQIFNFEMEHLILDNAKTRINRKEWNKITILKKRYGKNWMSREELAPRQIGIMFTLFDRYNRMGLRHFNKIFKHYIYNSIYYGFVNKYRKFKKKLKINIKMSKKERYLKSLRKRKFKDFYKLYQIINSYKKLYMFFSFLDKFFRLIPTYPNNMFNKIAYKILFRFFRMYFIFKPYWYQVSKYYELLFLYINIDAKISIYVLENPHLSAQYIAHYIMNSFRYRFDQRDTYLPIRKTLNRILFTRIWAKPNKLKKYFWNKFSFDFFDFQKDRRKFYRNYFFFNFSKFYSFKVKKYLKKLKVFSLNYYKKNRRKNLRKFDIMSLKKNIYEIKNCIFNSSTLLLKLKLNRHNKLKSTINKFNLLIFNYIYKNNIFFKLSNNNVFNARKYFYLNKKKLINLKKNNNKFKNQLTLFNNIKFKFIPLKKKIKKLKSILLKKYYFFNKKVFLLQSCLSSLLFILMEKRRNVSFTKTIINNNYYLHWLKYYIYNIIIEDIYVSSLGELKIKYKRKFRHFFHIRAKKHYEFDFFYKRRKPQLKYFFAEFIERKKNRLILLGSKDYIFKFFNIIDYNFKASKEPTHISGKKKKYFNRFRHIKFNYFLIFLYSYCNIYLLFEWYNNILDKSNFDKIFVRIIFNRIIKDTNNKLKSFSMKVNFKPSSIVNKILFKYSKEDLIKLKKSGFKLRILKNKTNLKNLLKYTKVKEKLLKKKSVIKQNIKNQNMNRTFTFIKSSNEPLIKSKDDILFKKLLDGLNNNFNEKKIIENKRKVQFNKQKKEFYDNKNNNNNYKKKDVKDKESVKEFNNSIIDILSKVVEKKKLLDELKVEKSNIKISANLEEQNELDKALSFVSKNDNKNNNNYNYSRFNNKSYYNNNKYKNNRNRNISFDDPNLKIGDVLNLRYDKFRNNKKKLQLKNKVNNSKIIELKFKLKKILNKKYEDNNKLILKNNLKKQKKYKYRLKKGYFFLFKNFFLNNYSKNYLPFVFNLNIYENYLKRINNLPVIKDQIKDRKINKLNLQVTPLINKFRRLKTLEANRVNVLYGYKFHFSGRFTRKQKAASLWYTKGANPVSSMNYDVEYGFHTVTLRYSACTLKVWLYKNKRISFKYGYKIV